MSPYVPELKKKMKMKKTMEQRPVSCLFHDRHALFRLYRLARGEILRERPLPLPVQRRGLLVEFHPDLSSPI